MTSNYGNINIEKLRSDMKSEALGAFFGGGFGGALVEAGDIENASPQELIRMAEQQGIKLDRYKGY